MHISQLSLNPFELVVPCGEAQCPLQALARVATPQCWLALDEVP